MRVFWLQPWAWLGLGALTIPLLVHLLVRQRSRRVLFPSLRFLRTSRLSALRHWKIADWLLLLVRMMILAMAVAALAAPVFVSDEREQSWAGRVARAVVVVTPSPGVGDEREIARWANEEGQTAFVARELRGPLTSAADNIRDAAIWLERQPPAAREVVIIGDFRTGTFVEADLELLPSYVGIRFLPVASADPAREIRLRAIGAREGATAVTELRTMLHDATTEVAYGPNGDARFAAIEVRAAPANQQRVEAALRAVMKEGVVLPRHDRRATIEFVGAPSVASRAIVRPPRHAWMRTALARLDPVSGGEHDGILLVEAGIPGDHPDALHLIARVVKRVLADDRRDLEPRRIPAPTLAAWSRPMGGVPPNLKPGNEGDGRLMWLAALALLGLESWMRRSRVGVQSDVGAAEERSVA